MTRTAFHWLALSGTASLLACGQAPVCQSAQATTPASEAPGAPSSPVSSATTSSPPATPPSLPDAAPPTVQSEKTPQLSAESFNAWVAENKPLWSRDALLVAAQFVGTSENKRTEVHLEYASPEVRHEAKTTVTFDGLLDDSIRARRYELLLRLSESTWVVQSVTETWRCAEDRGHQDFSTQLCE